MTTDELQKLYQTTSLNSSIITAISINPDMNIIQDNDKEKYYEHLAKESRAWDKYFAILQQRFSKIND